MEAIEKLRRRYPIKNICDTTFDDPNLELSDFIEDDEILGVFYQVIDKVSNKRDIETHLMMELQKEFNEGALDENVEYIEALKKVFSYKLTPGLNIYKANTRGYQKSKLSGSKPTKFVQPAHKQYIFYSPEHKDFLLPQHGIRGGASACAFMLLAGAGYMPMYEVRSSVDLMCIGQFITRANLPESALISNNPSSIEEIAQLIKENNSGILSVHCNNQGNLFIIVDKINISNKYAIIKDPYHGWKVKITLECLVRIMGGLNIGIVFMQLKKSYYKPIDLNKWQSNELTLEQAQYSCLTPEETCFHIAKDISQETEVEETEVPPIPESVPNNVLKSAMSLEVYFSPRRQT